MISLISRWQLLDGCPEALKNELELLPNKVKESEPDTWIYLVHLQAPNVLDGKNNPIELPPPPIPLEEQKEVIFLEVYKDEVAFSRHVNGVVFQTCLNDFVKYFKPDPKRSGWPTTNNEMLDRLAGFIRKQADSQNGCV